MKIVIDASPDELKELVTPGPNQISAYNNMIALFTRAWMDTVRSMGQNAWIWNTTKKD